MRVRTVSDVVDVSLKLTAWPLRDFEAPQSVPAVMDVGTRGAVPTAEEMDLIVDDLHMTINYNYDHHYDGTYKGTGGQELLCPTTSCTPSLVLR